MKKLLSLLVLLVSIFQSCEEESIEKSSDTSKISDASISATSIWTRKASVPGQNGGRILAVGFSIGNKGYIGTGASPNGPYADFWEYDPASNNWTEKASFPGGNSARAVSFTIANKGYVVLAHWNRINYDLWEYNPANNTWSKKAPFPVAPFKAGAAAAFGIGDKGYVGIFCGNFQIFEYDPVSNVWTKKAGFNGGNRSGVTAFSIGSKGYIGLGVEEKGRTQLLHKDFWEYDPETNKWSRKADFAGSARANAVGLVIGNKGYIATGMSDLANYVTGLRNDLWEFDPASNAWTEITGSQIPARAEAVAFSIGNSGYIGTGLNLVGSHYNSDFWEYTLDE